MQERGRGTYWVQGQALAKAALSAVAPVWWAPGRAPQTARAQRRRAQLRPPRQLRLHRRALLRPQPAGPNPARNLHGMRKHPHIQPRASLESTDCPSGCCGWAGRLGCASCLWRWRHTLPKICQPFTKVFTLCMLSGKADSLRKLIVWSTTSGHHEGAPARHLPARLQAVFVG